MDTPKLNPIIISKPKAQAIGGKGSIRRKQKKKVSSKYRSELLEKTLAPFRPSLIANISTVNFYVNEREKQLQFILPKMKTLEKFNLAILYGKAQVAPEPPENDIINELKEITENPDKYFNRQPNKNERKLRKTLEKLTPIEMPEVLSLRINVRKDKFQVRKPEVQKIPNENIYLIWGIIELSNSNILKVDRDEFQKNLLDDALQSSDSGHETSVNDIETKDGESNELLDPDYGFSSNDIELVMSQSGVNKDSAIKSLKENKGDLINAIMALT